MTFHKNWIIGTAVVLTAAMCGLASAQTAPRDEGIDAGNPDRLLQQSRPVSGQPVMRIAAEPLIVPRGPAVYHAPAAAASTKVDQNFFRTDNAPSGASTLTNSVQPQFAAASSVDVNLQPVGGINLSGRVNNGYGWPVTYTTVVCDDSYYYTPTYYYYQPYYFTPIYYSRPYFYRPYYFHSGYFNAGFFNPGFGLRFNFDFGHGGGGHAGGFHHR